MIPLKFLCDEYMDRPKLTEQKNPFEYIVPPPPPTSGVGTINFVQKVIMSSNFKRSLPTYLRGERFKAKNQNRVRF